jgi:hypothetical protein
MDAYRVVNSTGATIDLRILGCEVRKPVRHAAAAYFVGRATHDAPDADGLCGLTRWLER